MKRITKSLLRFLSHHFASFNNFFQKYIPQLKAKDSDSDSDSVSQSIIHETDDHQIPHFFPDHLVALILQNLNIPNRTRATLVCKSWKNILTRADFPPARDEAPWLIMSNDTYRKPESFLSEIHFQSFSENRIYRFTLPNPYGDHLGGGWLCGSSRGWLLIATGPDLNPFMFLWNPISGSVRNLPPLSTLPFFNDFVQDTIYSLGTNVSSMIPTIEVFSVGSEDCVVAAIFRNPLDSANSIDSDVLALCTPHDDAWTVYRREQNVQYEDILFHDGKLYAMIVMEINSDDEIGNWDFNDTIGLPGCEVELEPVLCYIRINNPADDEEEDDTLGVSISSDKFSGGHLVECSITGELVCVRAIYELCRFNSIGGPIESFELYQIVDYKIYSLNQQSNQVMSSLGEQTVFIGTAGSVAVNGGVRGGPADRIFFATERQDMRVEDKDAFSVRYQGVFNVRERKIRTTSLQQLAYPLQSKIGWFTPKP